MTRQEINREILKLLAEANEQMPDQRFGQLLVNMGVTIQSSIYNFGSTVYEISYQEESASFLKSMQEALRRLNGK